MSGYCVYNSCKRKSFSQCNPPFGANGLVDIRVNVLLDDRLEAPVLQKRVPFAFLLGTRASFSAAVSRRLGFRNTQSTRCTGVFAIIRTTARTAHASK